MKVKIGTKNIEINVLGWVAILLGLEAFIRISQLKAWTVEEFGRTKRIIKRAIIIWFSLLVVLNGASYFAYKAQALETLGWLNAGRTVAWVMLTLNIVYALYRAARLFGVVVLAETIVFGFVKFIVRLLPGDPPETPDLITVDAAKDFFASWFVNAAAWLVFSGYILADFPVYRNPPAFLMVFGLVIFLILGKYGWNMEGNWIKLFQQLIMVYAFGRLVYLVISQIFWDDIKGYGAGTGWDENLSHQWLFKLFWILAIATFFILAAAFYNAYSSNSDKRSSGRAGVYAFAAILFAVLVFTFGGQVVKAMDGALSKNKETGNNDPKPPVTQPPVVQPSTFGDAPKTTNPGDMRNDGYGQYYPNPTNSFTEGGAYKFSHDAATYVYRNGKLHHAVNERTFLRHYNCTGSYKLIIQCEPIYLMPTSVKMGDEILNGSPIR